MAAFPRNDDGDGLEISNAINPNDHGPYITIAIGLGLTCSFLLYIFRLTTRWPFRSLFLWDDALVTLATFTSLGQGIVSATAVNHGLGKHEYNLSDDRLRDTFYELWVSRILALLSICLARLGCALLVYRLTRMRSHIMACYVVSGLIATWGIVSMSLVGAKCNDFRHVEDSQLCLRGTKTMWVGIASGGVAVEGLLMTLPLYLVWSLQTSLSTKLMVLAAFWSRIPVGVVTGLRIHSMRTSVRASDLTWSLVRTEILSQVELHLAVCSATIPCIGPFLQAFNTGFLSTTVGQVDPTANSSKGSKFMDKLKATASSSGNFKSRTRSHSDEMELGPLRPDQTDVQTFIEYRKASTVADSGSLSERGSDKIIVRRTVDVQITERKC